MHIFINFFGMFGYSMILKQKLRESLIHLLGQKQATSKDTAQRASLYLVEAVTKLKFSQIKLQS